MPATTLPQLAPEIQYVSDGQGNLQSVIVPIDLMKSSLRWLQNQDFISWC